MIIPRFKLTQDDEFICISIFIKYAKISDMEVEIQDTLFWFYLKPYHLKLNFPGMIESSEKEKATYNIDKGELDIKIPKKNPGEYFENLDLVANFMKKKEPSHLPSIEVIGEGDLQETEEVLDENGYGFNRKDKGIFKSREEERIELFSLNPEEISVEERLIYMKDVENNEWNVDRYFEDMDMEELVDILSLQFDKLYKDFIPSLEERMNELSIDALIRLGNKDVLINRSMTSTCLLQIFDIIFAFCYEMRCLQGDTCESAANINKLSSTLSCLVEPNSLSEVVLHNFRRSLIYPLYRNIEISLRSFEDVKSIYQEGKGALVRILLKIKTLFETCEPRHLLNRLYIDDFIVWMQKLDAEVLNQFQIDVSYLRPLNVEDLQLNFAITDINTENANLK